MLNNPLSTFNFIFFGMQVDKLIVCGGMAFTFKKTLENVSIGDSLFDEDGSKKVAALVEKAKAKGVELVLPVDYITADKFSKDAKVRVLSRVREGTES